MSWWHEPVTWGGLVLAYLGWLSWSALRVFLRAIRVEHSTDGGAASRRIRAQEAALRARPPEEPR